jgi:hypothetical protein
MIPYWKKIFDNSLYQISHLIDAEKDCPVQWNLYHNRLEDTWRQITTIPYWKKVFNKTIHVISNLIEAKENCPVQWILYHNSLDDHPRNQGVTDECFIWQGQYYSNLPEVWHVPDNEPSRAWIKLHGRDWIELPSKEIKWKRTPPRDFASFPKKQKKIQIQNKRLEEHPLYDLLMAEEPNFWKIN